MLQHLQLLPIIVGAVIGYVVFFVVKTGEHEVVMKYPDPMNPGQNTYRDANGLCYSFKREEVDCAATDVEIKSYPLN